MKSIKILLLMLAYVLCMLSCDEPLDPTKEGKVLLGDKYVDVCTEFTDEQAIEILKSSLWYDDGYPYIYNNTQMVQVYDGNRDSKWYKFEEGGIFKTDYDKNDIDDGPEFEYAVKDKILALRYVYRDILGNIYSDNTSYVKLVGIDKKRVVFDMDGVNCYIPKDFPIKVDEDVKTRVVWNAKK